MTPYFKTPSLTIFNGDCLSILSQIPSNSIDCCVTSPPYFRQRDYGTATWDGGDPNCDHVANPKATKKFGNQEFNKNRPSRDATKTLGYYADIYPKCGAKKVDHQIGIEPSVQEYIDNLKSVFLQVQRVLKPSGTCWVNLGDTYHKKSLCLVPQRFAIAMQESNWIIRNEVIWSKRSPMPSSKKDGMTNSHETIWFMTKSEKYYYNYEAVKQPLAESTFGRVPVVFGGNKGKIFNSLLQKDDPSFRNGSEQMGRIYDYKESNADGKRNLWSVWELSPDPVPEAHFASYPREIPRRAILAGCPLNGVVLDPFLGSGRTAEVAKELNRRAIGIDLNSDYCAIAAKRCGQLTIFDVLKEVQNG